MVSTPALSRRAKVVGFFKQHPRPPKRFLPVIYHLLESQG